MIVLHNLKGQQFGINGALIERVDGETETHVLLTSGTSYIVTESIEQVVQLHREDRAIVLVLTRDVPVPPTGALAPHEQALRLVTAPMARDDEIPT